MPRCFHRPVADSRRALRWIGVCWLLLLFSAEAARAQLPHALLQTVAPAGGQRGATFDLTIAGTDLDGASRLLFSHPGITAQQKTTEPGQFDEGPVPVPNTFSVTVAADVPPGLYECRAAGNFGVSNPRAFHVGESPEAAEVEPNNDALTAQSLTLPVLVNGVADGPTFDCFRLSLEAGQRVLIDCWAQRIDSRMDATLLLLDSTGRELARRRDTNRRDPLLDFTAPAAGEYELRVFDFQYRAGADYQYRLAVGSAPYIEFVLPAAIPPGVASTVSLYGRNLPGGAVVPGLMSAGQQLERLDVQITPPAEAAAARVGISTVVEPEDGAVDGFEYRLPGPQGQSNAVLIGIAGGPPVLEAEPNSASAQAQALTVPCEVTGQFYPNRDRDWFQFTAKQGDVYYIEAISQRLGLGTDPDLLVQRVTVNEQGEEQVADVTYLDDDAVNLGGPNFTTTSEDPAAFRLDVPQDGVYRILVQDLSSSAAADPRRIYRLAIRLPAPGFRLFAAPRFPAAAPTDARPWSASLRRGGSELIEVMVARRDGFDGPVEVTIEGLPEGVTASSAVVGPGQTVAPLVLVASDTAPAWSGPVRIVGKAQIAGGEVIQVARPGGVVWPDPANQGRTFVRMTGDFVLGVSDRETAAFLVQATPPGPLEISRAGKLVVPLTITRRGYDRPLTLVPLFLPPNITAQNVALDGAATTANLELVLNPNSPLGTFSIYLQAQGNVSYQRDPLAIEAANARKAALEQVVADATAAMAAADQAKVTADQAAVQAQTEYDQAASNLKTAQDAAAAAAQQAQTAAEAAAQAKTAADGDANNADLAKAAADAAAVAATAEQASTTAAEAVKTAEQALADADVKLKGALEVKIAADQAAVDAAAKVQAAQAARTAAEQLATNLTNAGQPKDVAVFDPSTAVTFTVTAAPIRVEIPAPAALKQGTMGEVIVNLARLYDYADPVTLELALPSGLAGVGVQNMEIPAGQNQGKIVLTANADATPGQHLLTVRARLKLNGQDLLVEQQVSITIEPVAQQ